MVIDQNKSTLLCYKKLNKSIRLMNQTSLADKMTSFEVKIREKCHFFLAMRLNIFTLYTAILLHSLTWLTFPDFNLNGLGSRFEMFWCEIVQTRYLTAIFTLSTIKRNRGLSLRRSEFLWVESVWFSIRSSHLASIISNLQPKIDIRWLCNAKRVIMAPTMCAENTSSVE